MKRILISQETRHFILRHFGVTEQSVSRALNYKSNSRQSEQIRSLAAMRGGVVVDTDQMDTIHDSHGKMIQTWGGRVVLEADKTTGTVRVIIDGEEKEVHEHVSVSQLMKMQQRMAIWAAKL